MKRKSGFNLIELLVVVAIIALLIAILLPSLNRARENAKKSVCAANLKANGTGFAIYAAQFNDYLPVVLGHSTQFALIDVDSQITDMIMGLVVSNQSAITIGKQNEDSARRLWYCPSNTVINSNNGYWNGFNQNLSDKRVVGYNLIYDRGSGFVNGQINGARVGAPGGTTRVVPPFVPNKKFATTPYASETELMTDTIYTGSPIPGGTPPFDFYKNINGGGGNVGTSHLLGGVATGMNTLCFDGHVEWRNWNADPNSYMFIVVNANTKCWEYIMNPK